MIMLNISSKLATLLKTCAYLSAIARRCEHTERKINTRAIIDHQFDSYSH